jgi:hypothetical protein
VQMLSTLSDCAQHWETLHEDGGQDFNGNGCGLEPTSEGIITSPNEKNGHSFRDQGW